ncbi:MAG: hypothetical protein WA990_03710, partial [Rubrobacteraceae bacterium]
GCGGGESGGQQDSKQRTSQAKNGGSGKKGNTAPEIKTAVGEIQLANAEKRAFVLKPSKGDPVSFKALPNAETKLDGKEVDLEAMKRGQRVQVKYVTKERGAKNRAHDITLFGEEGLGGNTG